MFNLFSNILTIPFVKMESLSASVCADFSIHILEEGMIAIPRSNI